MSYCLQFECAKPQNPQNAKFCQNCGTRLLLGDRYRAFSLLSSGKSRTFLAIDAQKLTDARCIIKQFSNGSDPEAFRQTVARLDQLSQHPQIPDLFAYFERGEQQYIVQEFVGGRNLLQQMTEEGTFSDAQIRQLLQALLPVVQFLHDRQILHRDIKPTNLIRRSDGGLMLVDFGAAKHATRSALARTGTLLGSAEYAAPEQLMGKAIPPSDLYSIGVTCIQLLTGVRPFDLYSSAEGVWFWRSVAGEVSADLERVLDRLLQSDANQRYASATDVMRSLGLSPPAAATVRQVAPRPQVWQQQQAIAIQAPVNAIVPLPDASRLIVGSSTLQIWDLVSGLQSTLAGHSQPITALALSPDGQTLASGSLDRTVRGWDVQTGELRWVLGRHSDAVTAVAFSGETLLSSSRDRTVQQWSLETGQPLHSFKGRAAVEAIAADAQTLAIGSTDGTIQLWHLGTRELLRTLPRHAAAVDVLAIVAPFSGQAFPSLVSGSWDMTLELRHLDTGGRLHSFQGHLLPVAAAAVSPDGQTLATGSHDSTIRLWDMESGQPLAVLSGHTATVGAIAFLADDCLLSGSQDGTVCQWQRR